MGKKAGVDIYNYKYVSAADNDGKSREEAGFGEEKHRLEDQCSIHYWLPTWWCLGLTFGVPGCCCRDDHHADTMFWRKQHWREELYEAMENDCLFMSITSLLIVDVLCILSEFVVHDPGLAENNAAHMAGFLIKCTSLTILAIFQCENWVIMFALQEQFFWHVGHKIDFVVIPLSIFMETQIEADVGGLLVILRFWRLIRVVHGVWEGNQKKKGGEEESSEGIPEEHKEHFEKAKKEIEANKTAKEAAHDHHVEQGGESDHFHKQEHDHINEKDETDRSKWTPQMHAHYEMLTEHLNYNWEESVLAESKICPKYRLEMHEFLDQKIVHNVISGLLVCDVLIVIIEFVVHDDHFLESHLCHEMGFYFTSASLSILCFFQGEAFMNMNATGRFLFEFYGHFLDCIIIPLSIVLEFLLQGGAASLLIMLRLWRLVRIMHGVFTADEEKDEGKEKDRAQKREESIRHATHIVIKQKSIELAKKVGVPGSRE